MARNGIIIVCNYTLLIVLYCVGKVEEDIHYTVEKVMGQAKHVAGLNLLIGSQPSFLY
jgi:hypothetical protein